MEKYSCPESEKSFDELVRIQIDRYNSTPGNLEGYDCPECLNKGMIAVYDNGTEKVKECRCMALRAAKERMRESGLEDKLNRCTFDRYSTAAAWQKDIKAAARQFLTDCGKWFYIGGQVGSGKTHICTAITGELLRAGKSARYMMWRDDVTSLKAHITESVYTQRIGEFKNADVLYIDDFFKTDNGRDPTGADINIAFEIINYRYNDNGKITIISSEKPLRDIIGIDESVGSKIYERAKGYCISIAPDIHKNYRLRGLSL